MNLSCSMTFHIPKALPSLSPPQCRLPSLSTFFNSTNNQKQPHNPHPNVKGLKSITQKPFVDCLKFPDHTSLAIQIGAFLTTVAQPALAVTGVNDEEDLFAILGDSAIAAFFYFLVAPPIIMNWLRIRWYRRGLLEMYFQFMFVFLFFPGLLLWAPFLNFRKFPRDPSMQYPWSTPEDPSKIRNSYRKAPWATPEDYD